MAVSNVSRGAASELPHADDIRELTNRSLHGRDDYKEAMLRVRSVIQGQAAKGVAEVVVTFYHSDGTIPRAVAHELSVAGYSTSLDEYTETPDKRYTLSIWW